MSEETKDNDLPPVLRFTYQKGNHYRIVKADGAWGSITPRGEIIMSIFVERPPVPDYEEYSIAEPTLKGKPLHRVTETQGLIREVEVALALRADTALSIGRWLIDKARTIEKATGFSIETGEPLDSEEESGIKPEEE